MSTSEDENELDTTILLAIVIGSTGFVLMVLGGVYYLTRLGDVPSRKAVANLDDPAENDNEEGKDDVERGTSMTPGTGSQQQRFPSQSSLSGSAAPNFSPAIGSGTDAAAPREELIEIYAPAGKLGVILDTPGNGAPIVHEIRPNSVLKDELQVGDKVIALDDEDVRMMSANQVSRIISRKMENTTRKFSIIRTIPIGAQSDNAAAVAPPEVLSNVPTTSDEHNTAAAPREELIHVYAPAGKLGFVMQPNPDGPLTVLEIRPNSVLRDELQIGDKVIALDDEDVQMMTPNQVSKLISRKMENATRKFSIMRTIGGQVNE